MRAKLVENDGGGPPSSQQFWNLRFSIHRDSLLRQQLRCHAAAFCQASGECSVINHTMPAGGTAFFKHRSPAFHQAANSPRFFRAPMIGLCDISSPCHNPIPPPFCRRPGCRQTTHLLRTHRHQLVAPGQRLCQRMCLGCSVIPAPAAQKACGNQKAHVPHLPCMARFSRSNSVYSVTAFQFRLWGVSTA